jgi:hypothetical protein
MRFDPALVTPTSADVAPPEFIGSPAPIAGFVRSPALWRQIEFLSKPDSHTRDYHVCLFLLSFFLEFEPNL